MKLLRIIIIYLSVGGLAIGVSLDQTTAERILRENRYFLEFIDVSVANFGQTDDKNKLIEAYTHNFCANLQYLQGNYVKTYKKIKFSQELLKDLYLRIVDKYYARDTRAMLNISAPIIVQAKDKKAQLFLRLGYRDLETSNQYRMFGYNYNRFLYSNKIRYYIDAIKRARRGKRFAFLALLESKIPYEEKDEYRTQTIDEALRKTEKEEIADYERVKNLMTNMINRQLIENKKVNGGDFFLHHDDNYTYISKKRKSVVNALIKDQANKLKCEDDPDASLVQPVDTNNTGDANANNNNNPTQENRRTNEEILRGNN